MVASASTALASLPRPSTNDRIPSPRSADSGDFFTLLLVRRQTCASTRPRHSLRLSVHGQDRMHEQSGIRAVADRPQSALASALRLIVDFAGILDGQHMPTSLRCSLRFTNMARCATISSTVTASFDRKRRNPDLLPPIVRQLAHADHLSLGYPLRKKSATSPPSCIAKIADCDLHCRLLESRRLTQNHARFAQGNRIALRHADSHCNIRAQVSPLGGEGRDEGRFHKLGCNDSRRAPLTPPLSP